MNTTTDIIILIISISMVHGVWLSRQERIALIFVMMIGGLVILVSIIRLRMIVDKSHKADMTWDGVLRAIFWMIEMNLAIICACLPVGKVFLRKHFPGVIGYNLTSTLSQN